MMLFPLFLSVGGGGGGGKNSGEDGTGGEVSFCAHAQLELLVLIILI